MEVGADLAAFSSQVYAGDESNQNRRLPAYWTANLHTSYEIAEHVQLFADITNLFDRRYATYGTFFDTSGVANAIPVRLADPRTITLAQPRAIYGGIKLSW